jgi:hypothetical protein
MIDFQNAAFVKLSPAEPANYVDELTPLLVPGEEIQSDTPSARAWTRAHARALEGASL